MLKLFAVAVGGYLLVVLILFVAQRSLLYLPDTRPIDRAVLEGLALVHWPSERDFRGLLADVPNAVRTVVLFHGNAGRAVDRHVYVEVWRHLSTRVVLAEYPGYGGRDGTLSESKLVSDARDTIRRVAERFPNEPLVVAGESLGAGVVAAAVGGPGDGIPAVDGLLLMTPWDSLVAVAARHYAFVPVTWLLRDRYDSVSSLRADRRAKVVVLAEADGIIPIAHGETLYRALPAPKHKVVIANAGHNDWLGRVGANTWREIFQVLTPSGGRPVGQSE